MFNKRRCAKFHARGAKEIKRGEVWLCDLDPVQGSEQAGQRRPSVVLSNDIGNANAPIVTVAPLTSQPKNNQPTHVTVSAPWLPMESMVLLEQIRTVSKERIFERLGKLNESQMAEIEQALEIALGNKKYEKANAKEDNRE